MTREFGVPRGVDEARLGVADAIGARPGEVLFAADGTQANQMAVSLARRSRRGRRVVLGALDHGSTREAAVSEGLDVVDAAVDSDGRLDVDRWESEVHRPGTMLASLSHAAPDLGTLQPLAACASLARQAGVITHADAGHTAGFLPVDVRSLGVDLLTIRGETLPTTVPAGAVFIREGLISDEGGSSANHSASADLAVALAAALASAQRESADLAARLWDLTGRLRDDLAGARGVRVLGHATHRIPHIIAAVVPASAVVLAQRAPAGARVATLDSTRLAEAGVVRAGTTVLRIELTPDATHDTVARLREHLAPGVG